MKRQLIIVGFHRSGTSMLAQELYNAGLFMGKRLMPPNISNADGHYEDIDFFNFHEKLLRFNHTDWKYSSLSSLKLPQTYQSDMSRLIDIRNKKHDEWGFKDPRSSLFLNHWYSQLDNPFTLVIYRHYSECVNSLLHRSSSSIAYGQTSDISFWEDPNSAYKMWINYNQHIIKHIKSHPETSILISHRAVLDGFPIVKTVVDRFGFPLNTSTQSEVKKELNSSIKLQPFTLDTELRAELEETWNELERLSIAQTVKSINSSPLKKKYTTNELKQILEDLKIDHSSESDILSKIVKKISNENINLANRIQYIKQSRPLFTKFLSNDRLIATLNELIIKHPHNLTLYAILSEILKNNKKYEESEKVLIQASHSIKDLPPFYYKLLSDTYLAKKEMHKAHKYIEKAIKLNPKNQHFYKTTIAIYNEEGHYKKALEEIDKALSIENNNPNPIIEFNLKKIDILNVLGKDKEVKKVVEYLLLHFPTDNRVKNKNKSFKIEKPLETTDKQHLYKKIITNLQKDQYYLERTLVILDKIENPWAKNDLLGRIVEHLKFLKKNK